MTSTLRFCDIIRVTNQNAEPVFNRLIEQKKKKNQHATEKIMLDVLKHKENNY